MKYKVKTSSIDVVLLILSVVPFSVVPHTVEVLFKYSITGYILLKYLSLSYIKYNKLVAALLLSYTLVLTYSTYINTASFTWTLSGFMTGMQYLAMFVLFYVITKKYGIDELARTIFAVLCVLILLNDLLIPIIQFNAGVSDSNYLIGNKFSVSYLHCLLGAIAYCLQRERIIKKVFTIWFIYSFLISLAVKCTTGIIIAMAIILLIWFPNIIQRIINFPLAFPIALGVENILIWGSTNIFKQPWMQRIITGVFHKSANMTGRERLYSITLASVAKKPLLGYGHLTDLYRDAFGYGNAQNGLFHIVTQAGIIGAVVYFLMVTVALQNKTKGNKMYGLYMFVYAMLIGSAVEINLSTIFLIAVAMIYAFHTITTNNGRNI